MYWKNLVFILINSCLCSSEFRISPNTKEIHLKEGDALQITCTSSEEIDFFYPKTVGEKILTSVEIVKDSTSKLSKFILRRPKTFFGDTGWYGCIEARKNHRKLNHLDILVTPDTYDEIEIKWIYVYVKSESTAWVLGTKDYEINSFVGGNAIFPCRINSPEHNVTLSIVEYYSPILPLDDNLLSFHPDFDPKVGFTLRNVTNRHRNGYRCNNNGSEDDRISMYLSVLDPTDHTDLAIISSLEHVTIGQDFSMNCSISHCSFNPNLLRWITPRGNRQITRTLVSSCLEDDIGEYVSELTIKNVTENDLGEYKCQFFGNHDILTTNVILQLHSPILQRNIFTFKSNKSDKVNISPSPELNEPEDSISDEYGFVMTSQNIIASQGGSFNITCGFSANKFRDSIYWYNGSTRLAADDRVVIDTNVAPALYASELTIKNVDKFDEGHYICEGTTKDGSVVQNQYQLHVNASTALTDRLSYNYR